jgi:WD40 repeat protein
MITSGRPADDAPREVPGTVIGRYKLLERIGEGGFAVVYLAEQTEPVKGKVALKLLKPGMDSREVVARFEAERQALALMDHPNIREEDPPKPSTRISSLTSVELSSIAAHRGQSAAKYRHTIHGEIDWILLKALERDRSRRYATTAGLATDLECYLSGQPISAAPRSLSYRFLKVLRKHWKAAATAGAFALTLLAGTGVSIWQAHRASRAESDALRNAASAAANARESNANQRLAEAALERTLIQQAEGNLQAGEVELGLAHLARVLRGNPSQSYALARLCNLLAEEFSASPVLNATVSHGIPLAFVELSPDGTRIVTGAGAGVRIWETAGGKPVGEPIGLGAEIRSLQISPDGRLALGAAGSRVAAYDLTSGALVGRIMDHRGPIKSTSFSPDSQHILTASAANARLWHAATGSPVAQPMRCLADPGSGARILGGAFSPDGTALLTWSAGVVCLWTADGWEPIGNPMRHENMRLAWFSPDGSLVVTQQSDSIHDFRGGRKLWDARTGLPVAGMDEPNNIMQVAFSPTGKRMAFVTRDLMIRLWDAESRQPIGVAISRPEGYRYLAGYDALVFSTDGNRLVVGFSKDGNPAAQVYRTENGEPVGALIPDSGAPPLIKFSPDGLSFIARSGNGLRIREVAAGMPVGEEVAHQVLNPSAVVYDPGGKRIATFVGAEARIWDARTGASIGKPMKTNWGIDSAAFHPDGRSLLTSGSNGTAHLWDAASGSPIGQPLRHLVQERGSGSVRRFTARFSPDGQRVLTASQEESDGTAKLWNSGTGELIGKPMKHPRSLTFAGFSPDGSRVVTTTERSVHIWDGETGLPVGEPLPWEDEEEAFVSFSANGRWALASGQECLRLIDTRTGKPAPGALRELENYPTLRFHPKTDWIFATAKDGSAGIWDLDTGRLVGGPLRHQEPAPADAGKAADCVIEAAAFSPDGRLIITYAKAPFPVPGTPHPILLNGLQLWDARSCRPTGKFITCNPGPNAQIDPEGKRLLTCGGPTQSAFLWDIGTGERVGRPMDFEGAGIDFARFTPKGDRFLTKFYHTPKLWDSATGEFVSQLGELESSDQPILLNDLVFSADGERVALCTTRGVEIRSLRDGGRAGNPILQSKGIEGGEFTPDGQWLVTRSNRLVETWNTKTGERAGFMLHGDAVRSLKLNPGGNLLLTISGCFTHLWNPTTGEPIGRPMAHPHPVESAWFTRDGSRIVTRSNQTVRVFDLQSPVRRSVLLRDDNPEPSDEVPGPAGM